METDECDPSPTVSDRNKLALISLSDAKSVIIPTVPIFQIRQTSAQAISSLTQPYIRNHINYLNIEISSNTNLENQEQTKSSLDIDWSKSLFKPASNLGNSKRRECKSNSEDNYVNKLCDQPMNSQSNRLDPIRRTQRRSAEFSVQHNKHLSGKFGFNPTNTYKQKIIQLVGNKSGSDLKNNQELKSLKTAITREKKGLKRLVGGGSRIGTADIFSNKKQQADIKKLFQLVNDNELLKLENLLDTNIYDINCCDDKQRTCLHIASSKGNLEIVRLLISYGANPNIRDCVSNLPIHLAIISSHVPVVTLLLEAGTDIQSLDLNGNTVLHLAGTRLRWLLNDENKKASPKLKYEAIMIMNMIKQYLRRKKALTSELDNLADRLENVIQLEDVNGLDDILNQFDTLDIKSSSKKSFI